MPSEYVDEYPCPWCGDLHPAMLSPTVEEPTLVMVKADCDWPGTDVFTLPMPWGRCEITRWPQFIPYRSNQTTQESE